MKSEKRKTIGVFIDWIESSYHLELISALESTAHALDINLLTVVGGALHSPQKYEVLCNKMYDFINKNNVNGIIITSGSLGHYCTSRELSQFFTKYQPVPVVSISQSIPGIISIDSDNEAGLRILIHHLIHDHEYKKIGFIKGIEGNQDAEQRFNVYKQSLLNNNIPVDESLIAQGDFTSTTGREAVRLFLRERKIKPDAIVAANDEMAIGVIEELQSKNIQVPFDIAVVGFDDQTSAATMTPPLTTVRQNIAGQCSKALQVLTDIINNKPLTSSLKIPTEPVIRQSCGCSESALISLDSLLSVTVYRNEENQPGNILEKRKSICKAIQDQQKISEKIDLKTADINKLLDSFLSDLNKCKEETFIDTLNNMITKSIQDITSINYWLNILSCFVKAVASHISDRQSFLFIENLFFKAQILIKSRLDRFREDTQARTEDLIQLLSGLSEGIIGTVDIKSLMKLLSIAAQQLDIFKCYFSLFSNKHQTKSKILIAYDRQQDKEPRVLGTEFSSFNFIPDTHVLKQGQFSLRIHPFLADGVFLGFTVFEFSPSRDMLKHIYRKMLLAGILKGVFIYETMKTEAERLEALVNERTVNLKKAETRLMEMNNALNNEKQVAIKANKKLTKTLDELKRMQKDFVESEKMAALGSLVAGIAHEINTPIGIGVTAASYLHRKTQSFHAQFLDQKMTKSGLRSYFETAQEASSMILSNLTRAHELIRSFKSIAVDRTNENIREFNLKNYIQDVLLSLRPRLKKVNHAIIINCPDNLFVSTFPGSFSQIITNLILNSLIHAFKKDEKGLIEINITQEENILHIIYADNGRGIDNTHMKKIFDPFFTTNRGKGGTGLGLHLVYNIVKQRLGGNIICQSEVGKGVCFSISIPLKNLIK